MPKGRRNDPRAEDLKWGVPKKQRAVLLTDVAIDLIDDAAEKLGTTRSEAMEQLIRGFAPMLGSDFLPPSLPTSNGSKVGRRSSKVAERMRMLQPSLFQSENK